MFDVSCDIKYVLAWFTVRNIVHLLCTGNLILKDLCAFAVTEYGSSITHDVH
jgi:hypothetical protein